MVGKLFSNIPAWVIPQNGMSMCSDYSLNLERVMGQAGRQDLLPRTPVLDLGSLAPRCQLPSCPPSTSAPSED